MHIDPTYYFCHRLNQLEHQISQLKKENNELRQKIEMMKPVQVGQIEYKIHELHVQTLSGTLNVGLTSHGRDSVGEVIEKVIEEHYSDMKDSEDQTAEMDDTDRNGKTEKVDDTHLNEETGEVDDIDWENPI